MRAALLMVIAWVLGTAATPGQPLPLQPVRMPTVKVLNVPDFWGAYAIWGASGSDPSGRIWFGITSNHEESGSAHLYEFNPATEAFVDLGNVVAELERLRLRRPREIQMKIHSRIVRAADERVYFSSMDESGEEADGSKFPTWGGHLWRLGPARTWEHLAATPEALIAVAAGGPYVYTLGYFNHVLYQFDTRTGRLRSVAVGSAGGHVSRNFFVDDRGHAFVSRVTGSGQSARASLVEFDTALTEFGNQPLGEYFESGPDDSHGIVAVAPDGSGGWFFVTGKGRLYREEPQPTGSFALTDLGWIHPAGPRYVASMFRDDRTGVLYGVSQQTHNGGERFDWVTRLPDGRTTVAAFPYGATPQFPNGGAVLYGSMTRDASGRFYVVGSMKYKPVILQVTPGN